MQQASSTPKNQNVGIGLRKIVAYSHSSSQCLLVYIYSFWHGVIPTIYFIFYTCFTNFLSRLSLDCSARRDIIRMYVRTYVVLCAQIKTEVVTFTYVQSR